MIDARSFWELVERRAAATPGALFARDEAGQELSFGAYRAAAEGRAAGLNALGIGSGSVVAWVLPTRLSALVTLAALARLGAVQVPLLPIYRERELGFCARQTRARWLLVPGPFRGVDYEAMAREVASGLPGLAPVALESARLDADPVQLPAPPDPDSDPVRWIFYTSGTTSDPKGARHTDRALLVSSRALALALDLRPGDRSAMVFPVTHLGGANSIAAALFSGTAELLVERFEPATSIPFLAAQGVTHAGAGPVFYRAYLEYQRAHGPAPIFPRVRMFLGGGAPKPPELHYALKREIGGAGILSTYGMTECPIIALAQLGDPDEKLAHTEGRASPPGAAIRVLRPDGSEAAPGEEGELRVFGPQLFRGYVDASLDADAFDAQGFFRTGDLGWLDAEGHLVVSGRLKDVIIRKGENISAREVEELLLQHPKVADAAVIGLPDPERGERVCAVVVCRSAGDPLRLDELAAHLRGRRLMLQKIPEQLELVRELPRNPSGKVLKQRLRERLAGPGAGAAPRAPRA